MKGTHALVLVTVGERKEAERIARHLVDNRLAACVGILPQRSIFRWEDRIMEEEEHLLMIKTVAERFHAVRDAVLKMHTYELPEIISIEITDGSAQYLDWISSSVN